MPARSTTKKVPKVFVSHSHEDRESASYLEAVLRRYHAETFLDQHHVEVGEDLPKRLEQGIKNCSVFLLLWSADAAASQWVGVEWQMADDLEKKIIPYVLDSTPLPPKLDRLVWLDQDDQQRANAQLLKAVFGRAFEPEPGALFPGQWLASVEVPGVGSMTYTLELRVNGQVVGSGRFNQDGMFAEMLRNQGMSGFLDMAVPTSGTWSYEDGPQLLKLELVARGLGQEQRETIHIQATGRERGAIRGADFGGRTWVLERRDATAG